MPVDEVVPDRSSRVVLVERTGEVSEGEHVMRLAF